MKSAHGTNPNKGEQAQKFDHRPLLQVRQRDYCSEASTCSGGQG